MVTFPYLYTLVLWSSPTSIVVSCHPSILTSFLLLSSSPFHFCDFVVILVAQGVSLGSLTEHGSGTTYRSTGTLPVTTSLKIFRGVALSTLPCSVPGSWQAPSYEGNHGCSEFTSAKVASLLEDSTSQHPTLWLLQSFWSLFWDACCNVEGVMYLLGWACSGPFLSALWPVTSLCS